MNSQPKPRRCAAAACSFSPLAGCASAGRPPAGPAAWSWWRTAAPCTASEGGREGTLATQPWSSRSPGFLEGCRCRCRPLPPAAPLAPTATATPRAPCPPVPRQLHLDQEAVQHHHLAALPHDLVPHSPGLGRVGQHGVVAHLAGGPDRQAGTQARRQGGCLAGKAERWRAARAVGKMQHSTEAVHPTVRPNLHSSVPLWLWSRAEADCPASCMLAACHSTAQRSSAQHPPCAAPCTCC